MQNESRKKKRRTNRVYELILLKMEMVCGTGFAQEEWRNPIGKAQTFSSVPRFADQPFIFFHPSFFHHSF